jgi:putative oxygen-independent coproporphyrinogen III oxidase
MRSRREGWRRRRSASGQREGTGGTSSNRPGLYVHIPFCRTKCIYCDFYSVTDGRLIDRWLQAFDAEIALYKETFHTFDSLYIGGGTPTVLGAEESALLVSVLKRHFDFSTDTEFTVEANPDDIDEEKIALLRGLGVNRVSFGVQSFNDRELAFLGRRHDAAGAKRAIKTAKEGGFTNLSLDLIYGLPGQGEADWLANLEQAISFAPTHLSCYQLTLEGETPLRTMVDKGAVKLPTDKGGRDLFLLTSKFLRSHGFVHYEVSNYAAGEGRTCRHNQKYWEHVPYLGLGPAAHSFDGTRRWWNCRSVDDYCTALEQGDTPMDGEELLSAEQMNLERIYLGLRTRTGVKVEDLPDGSEAAIGQLRRSRLVRLNNGRISPTTRGYLVADSLPVLLG